MAAIDDLKEQRADLSASLDQIQAAKTQIQAQEVERRREYDDTITRINADLDKIRRRRDRITQAIRDLSDDWDPAA